LSQGFWGIHRIFVAETNAEIVACVLMSKQIKLWGGKVNVSLWRVNP